METARAILQDAIRFQHVLLTSAFADELIMNASPIMWYGRPGIDQWLTIGTNPSRGEFFHRNGKVRTGAMKKWFWRDAMTLLEYREDMAALNTTLDYASTYFESGRATTGWFGKPDGAKLEAFLNGMNRSFYSSPASAIHVDFFKYATHQQMGRLKEGRNWMEHPTSLELLERTIAYLQPKRLIVLGRDNCKVMSGFTHTGTLLEYPGARYELGRYGALGIPMIGLHFKPSEVFLGLGNGKDINGLHHGSYARREHLVRIGQSIDNVAADFFN